MAALRGRLATSAGGTVSIDSPDSPFSSAPRLFCKTEHVDGYNAARLQQLPGVINMQASHSWLLPTGIVDRTNVVPSAVIPTTADECGGLAATVSLAIGARVMLRRNVDTDDMLVNGAMGDVVGFEGATHGAAPTAVWVLFSDPMVGALWRGAHPLAPAAAAHRPAQEQHDPIAITAVPARITSKQGRELQRVQFPLSLAWALTVHKCQGISLSHAVVDLGEDLFAAGQAYVALSRVRTLEGLAIIAFAPRKVCNPSHKAMREYARLGVVDWVCLPDEDNNAQQQRQQQGQQQQQQWRQQLQQGGATQRPIQHGAARTTQEYLGVAGGVVAHGGRRGRGRQGGGRGGGRAGGPPHIAAQAARATQHALAAIAVFGEQQHQQLQQQEQRRGQQRQPRQGHGRGRAVIAGRGRGRGRAGGRTALAAALGATAAVLGAAVTLPRPPAPAPAARWPPAGALVRDVHGNVPTFSWLYMPVLAHALGHPNATPYNFGFPAHQHPFQGWIQSISAALHPWQPVGGLGQHPNVWAWATAQPGGVLGSYIPAAMQELLLGQDAITAQAITLWGHNPVLGGGHGEGINAGPWPPPVTTAAAAFVTYAMQPQHTGGGVQAAATQHASGLYEQLLAHATAVGGVAEEADQHLATHGSQGGMHRMPEELRHWPAGP
jgi:hypothetical protein